MCFLFLPRRFLPWSQPVQVLDPRPGQRQQRRPELRAALQGRLVVQQLPHGQPERPVPEGAARHVRGRRQLVWLEGIQVLTQEDGDEAEVSGLREAGQRRAAQAGKSRVRRSIRNSSSSSYIALNIHRPQALSLLRFIVLIFHFLNSSPPVFYSTVW